MDGLTKRFWPVFVGAPDFDYPCAHCDTGHLVPIPDTFQSHEPRYSSAAQNLEYFEPEWTTLRFQVLCRCTNAKCGEISVASGEGGVERDYDDLEGRRWETWYRIKSFFPAPRIIRTPNDTPSSVQVPLNTAFTLYWSDLGAAANALRNSLESLLDELGVPRKKLTKKNQAVGATLHDRLDIWGKRNPAEASLCFALKEVGNLGSHGDNLKPEEFFGAMELFEHVLEELYNNKSEKMRVLAANIQAGIKARKSQGSKSNP